MKYLKAIILLPNLPIVILIGIYVMIRLINENGPAELELKRQRDGFILNDEIKQWVIEIYPKHLMYFISFVSYTILFYKIFYHP